MVNAKVITQVCLTPDYRQAHAACCQLAHPNFSQITISLLSRAQYCKNHDNGDDDYVEGSE